jgi:hypothetical protein
LIKLKFSQMKKIAILIGSPTQPYLNGVEYDLQNMRNFLMSSIGGAWGADEIFTSRLDPNFSEIEPYLIACQDYDFAFVYFSGHGFKDTNNGYLRLSLNHSEKPFVSEFANRCNKQITVIDACRSYPKYARFSGLEGIGSIQFDYTNLELTHTVFDNYLKKCLDGRILLYSSKDGQNSSDTNLGGYFSTNLLYSAIDLSKKSQKYVLNICDVFNEAYHRTKDKHQPDIEYNSDNALQFPFVTKSGLQMVKTKNNTEVKKQDSISIDKVIGITLGAVAVISVTALIVELLTGKK